MKIFLSVPMKNKTKEEIEATISQMKAQVNNRFPNTNLEFINTYVEDKPPYDTSNEAIWYLGKSLEILSQCSVLVCLKDLDPIYNGCIIEKEVAKRYGLKIIELE